MSDNKYPVEIDTSKPFQLVRMTWKEDGEGKTFHISLIDSRYSLINGEKERDREDDVGRNNFFFQLWV